MRTSQINLSVLILLVALVGAIGCGGGGGPALQLPADPQAAPQASLEALFDQIALQLSTTKPGSDAALRLATQQKTVGSELGKRAAAVVRTRLSEVDRIDGSLPLGAVEREMGGIDRIRRWDDGAFSEISAELQQEIAASQNAIKIREQKLASTSPDAVLDRLNLLSELSALSGTGSEDQARYAAQRDAILRDVSQEAEEAIQNEDYEKAQDLLGIVQEVNPEDEAARQQKCQVDGKVILKQFGQAMETGRVTRSMDMLTEFSETDCFGEIKDGLAESAAPMVEAFGLLGQEAMNTRNLADAYQRYRDSKLISTLLLDRGNPTLPGISSFLSQVEQAYQRASTANEYGLAWGYLNVMTEFGPTTPSIRQRLRQTRDEIARRAVRGLTAYPFENPRTSNTKVGDAVSSKVVQHIFREIPGDVRIVEREQLERILEECKRRATCGDLDTADFIVQGSILDAKVETTEKSGSETRRVVTGEESITNPEYTNWAQLSERQRKKTPQPQQMITRDVTEDVRIEVNSVRKVGIISVSYRVVEASSGRVLFTDSMQSKQEFQDEGRQGVQLGNFKQETDFVELPPDIEILSGNDGLADKISKEIGMKLVKFLQNPEETYVKEADRFVNEGDYIGASRKAAYAIVLSEDKQKEIGSLRDDLKSYAMQSPQL
ncbi:MAG: CsgG/HfaB family protein [Myxococcota bacterium]